MKAMKKIRNQKINDLVSKLNLLEMLKINTERCRNFGHDDRKGGQGRLLRAIEWTDQDGSLFKMISKLR